VKKVVLEFDENCIAPERRAHLRRTAMREAADVFGDLDPNERAFLLAAMHTAGAFAEGLPSAMEEAPAGRPAAPLRMIRGF
jgi:hypothetical protein